MYLWIYDKVCTWIENKVCTWIDNKVSTWIYDKVCTWIDNKVSTWIYDKEYWLKCPALPVEFYKYLKNSNFEKKISDCFRLC